MVSCEEAAEMLSAQMDGELEEGERAFLKEHLQTCRACQGLQKRFRRVDRLLVRSHAKPDPGLEKRIERALRPAGHKTRNRLLRVAVAALVLIAVSLVLTMLSDKADADRVKERMYFLNAMNAETFRSQEAMLDTFEWELSAMRLMVNYSDMDAADTGPILGRIDKLMNEIERVRQKK